ncbi:hypothetical protein JA1_005439 [Spathaspora sp. JA1]|nr:hypothetical protein JA1_005439 [Spathaspora sp. JA1]
MSPNNKRFKGNNYQQTPSLIEIQKRKNAESTDPTEKIGEVMDGTAATSSLLELVSSQIRSRCLRYAVNHDGKISILEIQAIASSHLVGSAAAWLDGFMRPRIENIFDAERKIIKKNLPMDPEEFLKALHDEYHEEQSKFGLSLEVGTYFQKNQSYDRYRLGFRKILSKYAHADQMEQEAYLVRKFRENCNVEYQPILANVKTFKDIDEIVARPEVEAKVKNEANSFNNQKKNNRNNNQNNRSNRNNNNNNNRSRSREDPKVVLSFSNTSLQKNVNVKGTRVERLWVTLQGISIQPALLDSACEANFVHTSLVKHLDVQECSPIAVYAADNSFMVTINKYISILWLEMNKTIKFYLADISIYPIVLGAEISTLFRHFPDNIQVIPMNINVLTSEQIEEVERDVDYEELWFSQLTTEAHSARRRDNVTGENLPSTTEFQIPTDNPTIPTISRHKHNSIDLNRILISTITLI